MKIVRLDHIQLAMPRGGEAAAVDFYEGILGIPHVPKPSILAVRGGCWFESGDLKIHLGVEDDFRPARKAHPALAVDDLDMLADHLRRHNVDVRDGDTVDGVNRIYVSDPFGNRIELLQI